MLDKRGKRANRFKKQHPTVGLCQQPDLPVDRLELLHQPHGEGMAQRLTENVALLSPDTEVHPRAMTINDPWGFKEVHAAFFDFAIRYSFGTEDEEYLVYITTRTYVAQIYQFLLTKARYLLASLLRTSPTPAGSSDKAVSAGVCSVIDLDLSRYAILISRFQHEQQQSVSFLKAGIDTRNATFSKLIDRIERVALRLTDPILLTGPTGTGKSFLAKRIFQLRQSRHLMAGKLIAVNCTTLRGDNAMSTLFGHMKGTFTGALTACSGLLREADGGVLFLDEIIELGLDGQAMLLKAIEKKTFLPSGSDKKVQSDFQLIVRTHRDIQQWIAEGRFRENPYVRINMWNFAPPSLAQRREDIVPGVEYELHRFSSSKQTQVRFDKEAHACYLAFACSSQAQWRDNSRELSSSIARMTTLAEQGCIALFLAEEGIMLLEESWQITATQPKLNMDIDLFDHHQLETALEMCCHSASLSEAGRELFAVSRQKKANPNDADRLRKCPARSGLSWESVRSDQMQ